MKYVDVGGVRVSAIPVDPATTIEGMSTPAAALSPPIPLGLGSTVLTVVGSDTLAIGAFGEASSATGVDGNQADNAAMQSGAVYVFSRSDQTWSQQA